jgi:hypothetical protein
MARVVRDAGDACSASFGRAREAQTLNGGDAKSNHTESTSQTQDNNNARRPCFPYPHRQSWWSNQSTHNSAEWLAGPQLIRTAGSQQAAAC